MGPSDLYYEQQLLQYQREIEEEFREEDYND